MKNLRIASSIYTRTHWNNGYTLFSESVALLQKMISIPSFSGQERPVADLIEAHLKTRGVAAQRLGNNVWCFNKHYDRVKPTILLNSHLDTVRPNEGYTRDPFLPEISHGKLFGLGSNDAGGCVISLMAAFLHFYHQQNLGFNICLAITAEEENSGESGIRLLQPLLGKIDFAIVGEPTLLNMAVSEKGNLVIDCTSDGRAGHAAREEGDNAIYKALKDIEWFRKFQFPTCMENGFTAVRMTVTQINAGIQHNIVPGTCKFTVDIRHDDSYSHQQIIETIRKHISAEVNIRPSCSRATTISAEHPIIKIGIALGCKTYDSPTSSDRAWINCPSVKLGPGNSARSHMPDEFIILEEIKKGMNLYIKLLERLPLQLINGFLPANHFKTIHN